VANDDKTAHRAGGVVRRRRFLGMVGSIIGAVTFWRSAPAAAVSRTEDPRRFGAQLSGFLRPAYLPMGWRAVATFKARSDGFAGPDEIAYWYMTIAPSGVARPLSIYQTREPSKEFATTETHRPMVVALTLADGSQVNAQYHDGTWALPAAGSKTPVWDTQDVQSLVFDRGDLRVGIRASRYAGIDLADLLRVAASLS